MGLVDNILLPYQKKWVANEASHSIYLKSRRIGISWAEACWSVKRRCTTNIDHIFCSTNQKTAAEFIRYCKTWAKVFEVILGQTVLSPDGETNEMLRFVNGSRIIALSSNPVGLRGAGGGKNDLTIDEYAFHEDAEELYRAAQPVVMWGGQLRIISTHNGAHTIFNKILNAAPSNGFKIFKTTLFDAVEQGLAHKVPGKHHQHDDINAAFIEHIKQTCFSEVDFEQEYGCQVSTSTTLITEDEYRKCILKEMPIYDYVIPHDKRYGPLYCGIDIGRSKNISVIWVVEEGFDAKAPEHLQKVYRTIAVIPLVNMPFTAQYQRIAQVLSHPDISHAYVDQGAIGAQLAEDLVSEYGGHISPFSVGHVSKARIVGLVVKLVAQERVSLPDDPIVMADILCMQKVVTKSGNLTYDGNSGDSHADRFMALAMALDSAHRPTVRLLNTPELN